MVLVSFLLENEFSTQQNKKQIRYIYDVLEINDQSCCILFWATLYKFTYVSTIHMRSPIKFPRTTHGLHVLIDSI